MRHECIVLAESPGALAELGGISLLERLLRLLQRLGLTKTIVLTATPDLFADHLANPSPHRAKVAIDLRRHAGGQASWRQIAEAWPNDAELVLVTSAQGVFDPRLFQLLDDQNSAAALVDSAPPPDLQPLIASVRNTTKGRICGAALLSHGLTRSQVGLFEEGLAQEIEAARIETVDIANRDWNLPSLRRHLRPYWFPAPGPEQRKRGQDQIFDAAQKGALDFPAMVHAPIENLIVSRLCQTKITPNQLTAITNVAAWGATFLFITGDLGWGTILALAVGVLDGLDGKLARVKVETSKAGKLEHWFDAFFENSWWIALAYYFHSSGQLRAAFGYLALLIGAEAVAGLSKFSVIRTCGRTIDEIGDFNRLVRLVGGRRNIYVWIFALGVLLGTPAQAFKVMAWWGAVTAAVQVPRAAFAVWSHRRQRSLPPPQAKA